MERKTGYCIITYRFRLYCQHKSWLLETKGVYNRALGFYLELLLKEPELAELSSGQQIMRRLELLSVGARGQEKGSVRYPLPMEKLPLYFRRAAINDAIRIWRSQKKETISQKTLTKEERNREKGEWQAAPMFYQGMYKDFTSTSISLKLWNGEKWVWEPCRLDTCGRIFPAEGKRLSPVLKFSGGKIMLHVPVREEVEDIRTVKERFLAGEPVCGAAFPSNDCLAVLVILDRNGECTKSLFIREGKKLSHSKRQLLNRIKKNRSSMGMEGPEEKKKPLPEEENKYLKEKIRNLTNAYAHKVSRQIVDFCEKEGVCILAVPNYKQPINLNQIGYLSATSYDWLGRRIIGYLRYKAFGRGIVVTSVSTKGIASTCHICQEPVKRFNKRNKPSKNYYGGKNFICPNGHRGNSYFNEAMNIGRRFLFENPW